MQDTINKVDKQHVEKRVRDWEKRISDLYATIKVWLKGSEFSLKPGGGILMYEEPMFTFNVPAREIETTDIYIGKTFVVAIKPRGLWVIGTNGMIEILTTKGSYRLIDFAEEFETPQWKLFNGIKNKEVEFNKQTFLKVLKESI